MPTYKLSSTNSDLTGGADFDRDLDPALKAPGDITIVVAAQTTEISYAYTVSGVPSNDDWETGVITVEVSVTTSNVSILLDLEASRVSSSGSVLETSGKAGEQTLGFTGVFNFTIPSEDWDPGAAGDRIRINYHFRNSGSMGNAQVKIAVNSTDTDHVTVISEGGTYALQTLQPVWNVVEKLTYYLSKITPNLAGGDDFDATLLKHPEAADQYSVTVPNATTDTSYAFTKAGSPFNVDWETGNFIIKVERVE